jgi:carbamoyl-phosphate synthase large subunit
MSKKKLTIAVTGLIATDNPAPGIPVTRSLREAPDFGGKVIGLAYDALDTGIYDESILDKVYMIPYPTEGEGNLLHRLRYIKEQTDIDVIVPTLDAELLNFCRLKDELADMGIGMHIPSEMQLRLRSKVEIEQFCRANGFDRPRSMVVTYPGQIPAAAAQFGWPLIVKGIFYDAYVAANAEEASVFFQKIRMKWGLPIILQENIPGEEYDVVSLGNPQGKMVGAVPMRKLRLTDKGKAWAGITIHDQSLLDLSKRMVETLKWTGPLELEFMKSSISKRFYLIEINPRFPSWCYLSAKAGQNLPWAAVRMAAGEKVEELPPYEVGLTFVRHAVDLVCPMNYLEALTTIGELDFKAEKPQ